ncbi:lactonase family protein [Alkalihalobacillus sp. LMS39]|uniref:lactonase family protein n=1 Tax=Alkalihalobacillus sp. LMS39 TaxID=2924032 RepID=UPI001FB4F675|nr:lactonase family protein [Alkalihalobacillus sp. LMS39]UOE92208.1 lactonase family protein [Alkalihalobacillus sp. LMS39]
MSYQYIVGTYAKKEEEGIFVYSFDPSTGKMSFIQSISGIDHPSYVVVNQKQSFLYAVSETEKGEIVSYHLQKNTGKVTELDRTSTKGSLPCFISENDKKPNFLQIANYGGSICTVSVNEQNGKFEENLNSITHTGKSVNPDRQEGPHPHSIVSIPNTNYVVVPDLGADCLVVYEEKGEALYYHHSIAVAPGAGPRHCAFHPRLPVVYVMEELSSTISIFTYDENGQFQLINRVSTLPKDYEVENTGAEIKVDLDGEFLYASNRGHNSIASFSIAKDGSLMNIGYTNTKGETPRHFSITPDNRFVLVANQDSDCIVVFKKEESGLLKDTGYRYSVKKPVCLQPYFL